MSSKRTIVAFFFLFAILLQLPAHAGPVRAAQSWLMDDEEKPVRAQQLYRFSLYEDGVRSIVAALAYAPPKIPTIPSVPAPYKAPTIPTAPFSTATTDSYYTKQWGLSAINVEAAWNSTRGKGVTIAVIDTGLDFTHPDIQGNIWSNPDEIAGNGKDDDGNGYIDDIRGWDFYNNDNNATDDNGHGTHVAGISSAVRNNYQGIAGVAPESKVMALKALDSGGGGTLGTIFSALSKAIRYAANEGAKVINMSLGIPSNLFYNQTVYNTFKDAVAYAKNKGAIIVASAGNSGSLVNSYPALFSDVISVGAMSSSTSRASYSSYGSQLDVAAPGSSILSLKAAGTNLASSYDAAGKYMYLSGTSMAAPMVSGTIALLLSANPKLSFNDIYKILQNSSTDKGSAGYDIYYGFGMINPYKALSLAASTTTSSTTSSATSTTQAGSGGSPGSFTQAILPDELESKMAMQEEYSRQRSQSSRQAPESSAQTTQALTLINN